MKFLLLKFFIEKFLKTNLTLSELPRDNSNTLVKIDPERKDEGKIGVKNQTDTAILGNDVKVGLLFSIYFKKF